MERAERSIISGSLASVIGTGISSLLSILYISLGARWLGPAQYGTVAVAISTVQLVFVLLNPLEAGLTLRIASFVGGSAQHELVEYFARSARALGVLSATVLLTWCVCLSLSHASAPQYAVALFFGASMCANLPRAVLRGRESFAGLAVNWIVESVARLGMGLVLIHMGFGALGMVSGYALGMGCALAHGLLAARRGLPAPHSKSSLGMLREDLLLPLRAVSLPLIGLHVYTAVAINADMMFAEHYLSRVDAGVYGGSASLARIVLVAGNPILLVLFSRLAALNAARASTGRTVRLAALVVVAGLGLSLLLPFFAGDLLVHAFLGDDYADALSILRWQWGTACVLIAHTFFAEALLATSRVRGGVLFVLPALACIVALAHSDASGVALARASFLASATCGTLVLVLLWRLRAQAT